tara:strand:+ start:2731 stop:3843 length:1113 start_codon:yes stop_codon:yes gene_type:complete
MTYKETLFFIGQSLTINHEEKNKIVIEEQLKKNTVDWDAVVKVSTGHFVFPALYCNLKRAHFLHYLPEDLVQYMQHITDLNRDRNEKIIAQAKEINALLLANNITPIFLKGTGNLLEGLYEDIAERMVGDIDFIVSKGEYQQAIKVLLDFGYENVHKEAYYYPEFKHYPRIHKKGDKSIVAVEIHKELLAERYADEFNYELIKNNTQMLNGTHVLNYANQLNLTVIAKQINDFGEDYKTISLRNTYDVFLLSQKTSAQKAIANFNKLYNPLNNFLAISYEVMGKVCALEYTVTNKTKSYVNIFYSQLEYTPKKKDKHHRSIAKQVLFKKRIEYLLFTIYKKEFRQWILNRIRDKKWKQQKLQQLGFKKRS